MNSGTESTAELSTESTEFTTATRCESSSKATNPIANPLQSFEKDNRVAPISISHRRESFGSFPWVSRIVFQKLHSVHFRLEKFRLEKFPADHQRHEPSICIQIWKKIPGNSREFPDLENRRINSLCARFEKMSSHTGSWLAFDQNKHLRPTASLSWHSHPLSDSTVLSSRHLITPLHYQIAALSNCWTRRQADHRKAATLRSGYLSKGPPFVAAKEGGSL